MDTLLIILLVFAGLMLATNLFLKKKEIQPVQLQPLPETYRNFLKQHVNFYNQLDAAKKAEYFFERPDLLQTKHPELYNILSTIFRQQPPKPEKT